jgi:subtilisin family serine protease
MRKGFLSIWAAALALGLAILALERTNADQETKQGARNPEFIQGEVVVKLKPSAEGQAFQAHSLLTDLGRLHPVTVRPLQMDGDYAKVRTEDNTSISQLLADVEATGDVEFAEPNFLYRTMDDGDDDGQQPPNRDPGKTRKPNDPDFDKNWGLFNFGQKDSKGTEGVAGADIGATKAWAIGTGSKDMVVAVIDTGVDYNHPDLKNNVDKEHGYNFNGKNNDPMDDNRHGTHCSGTIGAEGDNGIGTAGVNWHVTILPIKFLSAAGSGSLEDAVESIKYATKNGAKIMSNSWGGGGFSQTMLDAIKEAREKGILFVAAAGNNGEDSDTTPMYPASYDVDNVLAVAATNNRDEKASFSNYGQTKVHLAAPGVNIYSTTPTDKGGYDHLSGTSMATPHASGAAALLWSLNPNMTYADIKTRLMTTVDPIRSLKRKTVAGGRLNVFNAITNTIPERKEPPADRWRGKPHALESEHPYKNDSKLSWEISHPGAKFLRLHFAKIATEKNYDVVKIVGSKGEVIEELSGNLENYTTDYIEGDKLTITFTSDASVDGWGFQIDKYEFID